MKAQTCTSIFNKAINNYHVEDHVDHPIANPYDAQTIENLLYRKCWIDTVQWHLEDIIRDPEIDNNEGIKIKRRIDKSNQDRTDLVEQIDDWFNAELSHYTPNEDARLNTESIAWVLDQISILCLKLFHMKEQVNRTDVSADHAQKCQEKYNVLLEQEVDMTRSYSELLEDIKSGKRVVKVYRQMKMYNDESLNPILYQNKK
ncbi:MAG: DUF4254 domain-containing protein [Flavobacteriales bacterium]|nr:DUF4254 domain-containing protein [Flavobacteriales bacterium]